MSDHACSMYRRPTALVGSHNIQFHPEANITCRLNGLKPYFYNMSEHLPSHDDFIRNILSNKEIAVEYFKNYLPDFVRERLDFSKLEQLPGTYLSDELKKTLSDIIYSCGLKGGKGSIKVSLLIEHKSHPDKYTPVQIGGYIFSALQK